MTILKFILINTVAVALMTGFSYVISQAYNINFSEPKRLKQLVNRARIIRKSDFGIWVGWCLHFGIGLVFLLVYFLFRNIFPNGPELVYALIFGFLAGLLGVVGWRLMFALHDNPPQFPKFPFYVQLVGAHIVFSATVAGMLFLF
ncbi:conserved hypothetical membrane protein (DUF2938) [Formosa agariphila KMM 3901]|uniref:Conserved hypothetical membrane protein (DUF2938) n=1 Tax=Formosa agariphila (strain DSM 15362 / KCTC 12365 / LMG 23005 / KMM 3901 / M-2Alg 35-1) TaxID=1347342 RepID=T2KID6_FORAG|nr:hypothetical protein [Formosa agariphila]CDF78632.1 conserved hypothetical membrane protein (DUF2938) [Formosa agariphila KMM 3901]